MPPSRTARSADPDRVLGLPTKARLLAGIMLLIGLLQPAPALAQKVRITALSDVNFGSLANLQADSSRSQSLCVFSSSTGSLYSITASGSGAGSSFALTNGTASLPYEVQWASQAGQTSGTSLSPNIALTGQASSATQQTCNSGPSSSASLTIILRASSLGQAREGSYSGSLTLLVAAE